MKARKPNMKKAHVKLAELMMYLEMTRYRRASMFPGPGIDEDEQRLLKEIKQIKEKYGI